MIQVEKDAAVICFAILTRDERKEVEREGKGRKEESTTVMIADRMVVSGCYGCVVGVGLVRATAADDGEAEPPQLGAEDGAHGDVDEELETGIADAEPEDAEVKEGDGVDAVLRQELVQREANEGQPTEPERHDEDERHEVRRVGEVLAQRRRVLLVLGEQAGSHLPHRVEDVKVSVGDGGERRAEHQDDESDGIGGHARPVQMADVGLGIEVRFRVARRALKQRRTAGQHGREPREDDPTLASGWSLNGLVTKRFPYGKVPIHRDPHERIHRDGP